MGYIEQDNNLKGKQEENPQQISGKPKLIIISCGQILEYFPEKR